MDFDCHRFNVALQLGHLCYTPVHSFAEQSRAAQSRALSICSPTHPSHQFHSAKMLRADQTPVCSGVPAAFQELRELLQAAATSPKHDSAALSVQDVLGLAITAHALLGYRPGPGGLRPFAEGPTEYAREGQSLRDALTSAITRQASRMWCCQHGTAGRIASLCVTNGSGGVLFGRGPATGW